MAAEQKEGALLSAAYRVQGNDFNRAGEVSTEIKSKLKRIGFKPVLVRRVAIASFEAEMNVIMYASSADVLVEVAPERITVEFRDKGPGIPDIELAMREGYSTATPEMRKLGFGAGMGLPTMRSKADRFSIDSELDEGTVVTLWFNV